MERFVIRDKLNNKGMTLIEMLIALVLLLITSLAMLQTLVLAIQTNVVNSLRDEAVNVAETRMSELRNEHFTNALGNPNELLAQTDTNGVQETAVARRHRASSFSFDVRRKVLNIGAGADAKQVSVTVTWTYKNVPYTHTITTILRRQ